MGAGLTVIRKFMGNSCSFMFIHRRKRSRRTGSVNGASSHHLLMTFRHFLVRIRRAVRHGFMSNNGLFMLVHTGHTRSSPLDPDRSRSRLHLVSRSLCIVDAIMDIHGFSGPGR